MNYDITYYEMIQISLEAMGAAFCIVCIIALFAYGKTKITNTIVKLLALNTIMQINDATAYFFRGNTDSVSMAMTRITNYIVFLMQMLMILYFLKLTFDLLGEYGIITSRKLMIFANVAIVVEFAIMTINLFTGIAYYFDENNYYHRNVGWFVYTAIVLLIMVTLVIYVMSYRKMINRALLIGILAYTLIPLFSCLVQLFLYGISLNNFAVTISLIFILCIYLKVRREKYENSENDTKNKNFRVLLLCFQC